MKLTRSGVRRIGSALILAGDALSIFAIFLPWERLFATTNGKPDEHWYGPWVLTFQDGAFGRLTFLQFLAISLPFLLLTACSAMYLVTPSSRYRVILAGLTLLSALICFLIAGVALEGLPIALSETFPYYQNGYYYGIWIALVSGPCVALGIGIVIYSRHSASDSIIYNGTSHMTV